VSGGQAVSSTAEERAAEPAIRALIERWAAAVRAGDLEGVLADHADDIQMFDVPPPSELRGIGAYRETWHSFPAGD
jgi:ketosteroid isomerase-like protein